MRERKEKGDLETLKSNSLLSDEDVKLMIIKSVTVNIKLNIATLFVKVIRLYSF